LIIQEVAGSLVTASHIVSLKEGGLLQLQIDYTTPRKVKGVWGKAASKFEAAD
jgi:hypothetical protein